MRQRNEDGSRRLAVVCLLIVAPLAAQRSADAPAPTRIVHFTPPASLPANTAPGECTAASVVASYRGDAFRCRSNNAIFDPCFVTARAGAVLCDVDPRRPSSGTVVVAPAIPAASAEQGSAGRRAWFFELADGSTCQPLTGARREVDGAIEMYRCRFGATGDADAVLGDLDASSAVWTIQKVLLNKKVDPQTIKSLMIAPVKTVWQ